MLTKPSPMAVAASCDACRWACAAWACQANADPSDGVPVCRTTSRRYRFAIIASAWAISSCNSMIVFCIALWFPPTRPVPDAPRPRTGAGLGTGPDGFL